RAERARLAAEVHPLAAVRGPPGTHDVDLGLALLDALERAGPVRQPRFDKAADDRAPESAWPVAQGPADIVLFEGWCVGAKPQPDAALGAPINVLETQEDPHGVWRRWVNGQLAGPYRPLFARLARLILLRAPHFSVVRRWRGEAEAERRAQTGGGMSAAEIDRFVQVYERLSGHIAEEMAGRADVVITLDANRNPVIQ
ncbi:MAG TPA: kinase, partial [Caulobacteraceae bacterium]